MKNMEETPKPVARVSNISITQEDYDMLTALDADIEHARHELERAERVGIDVTELKKQLEDAVKLRNSILTEYKPTKEKAE